ncbi:unnamed protein product, partial [Polarella glacialis]
VQLCDPDASAAKAACEALRNYAAIAPAQDLALCFEQLLAPCLGRLAELRPGSEQRLPFPAALLEELLELLAVLLERVDPTGLVEGRARRIFPLVCERLLVVLEAQLGSIQSKRAAVLEEAAARALRGADALLRRWYLHSDRGAELTRMQLGFLVHLTVQLLVGLESREQRLRCLGVLRVVAEVEQDPDVLACFYPGVCTALARLLLQGAGDGDFKLGSRVVAAACDAWRAWLCTVLADSANAHLRTTQSSCSKTPFTLAELFRKQNERTSPVALHAAAAASKPQGVQQHSGANRQGSGMPTLLRDATWLEETSARTAEALVAALHPTRGPAAVLWSDKAVVRKGFIDLSLAVLKDCRSTLPGPAVDSCFEAVLAGLSDDAAENRAAAEDFLKQRLVSSSHGEQPEAVLRRLADWLVKLFSDLRPLQAGRRLAPAAPDPGDQSLPRRLARADGLLRFLGGLGDKAPVLPAHLAEALLQPLLSACALDPGSLQQTLRDERSLASLPGSAVSQAESLVQLFPYGELGNPADDVVENQASVSGTSGWTPRSAEAESQQVSRWLARSLCLGGGNVSLATQLKSVVGHLPGVFGAEALFSLLFDDPGCKWQLHPHGDGDGALGAIEAPFPLRRGADQEPSVAQEMPLVRRRSAAMFAMAVWFQEAINAASRSEPRPKILLSEWLPRHCVRLALSARGAATAGANEEVVLHDICACQLLENSLSMLGAQGQPRSVHKQVKHVLVPLLEGLGARSFVISTASSSCLARLYSLLRSEGSLQTFPPQAAEGVARVRSALPEVQWLLAEYADYLVGDICFRLRFEATPGAFSVHSGHGEAHRAALPALLVAVVQHAGLEMTPFLADVVHTLLTSTQLSAATTSLRPGGGGVCAERPEWVLRVLACAVQRLALLICDRRAETCRAERGGALEQSLPSRDAAVDLDDEEPSTLPTQSSALAAFLTGRSRGWKPPRRRDGFFLADLGLRFDEDAVVQLEEDKEEPVLDRPKASKYGRERRVASSVVLWARHHLQSTSASTRHLAHLAVLHGLTVLSTRVKDLLPHIHDVWQQAIPSFSPEAPLAVQSDGCVLLKHVARLSGDFIRRRFVEDCWPGLWARLRASAPVPEREADAWSPKLKAQLAALDALSFLAGDSVLMAGIAEQVLALALKFWAPDVADRLRRPAWTLLQCLAAADPDLLWLYLRPVVTRSKQLPAGAFAGPQLLEESGVDRLSSEDRSRLQALLDLEDSRVERPRIGLGPVGGELWASFLFGGGAEDGEAATEEVEAADCRTTDDQADRATQPTVPKQPRCLESCWYSLPHSGESF